MFSFTADSSLVGATKRRFQKSPAEPNPSGDEDDVGSTTTPPAETSKTRQARNALRQRQVLEDQFGKDPSYELVEVEKSCERCQWVFYSMLGLLLVSVLVLE
jgi:hypothetical protein